VCCVVLQALLLDGLPLPSLAESGQLLIDRVKHAGERHLMTHF
jgi:hypothetical protein